MRGFDIFMRVAKRIYRAFPDVLFAVAGSDSAGQNFTPQLVGSGPEGVVDNDAGR